MQLRPFPAAGRTRARGSRRPQLHARDGTGVPAANFWLLRTPHRDRGGVRGCGAPIEYERHGADELGRLRRGGANPARLLPQAAEPW